MSSFLHSLFWVYHFGNDLSILCDTFKDLANMDGLSKFDFVSFILILVVHLLKSENHSTSIMLSHVITFTKMTAVIILPWGQPFFYKICVSPLIRISWDNRIEKHAVIVQHHNLDITYTSISIFYYPTSIHLFILNRIHPGSWILHIIM